MRWLLTQPAKTLRIRGLTTNHPFTTLIPKPMPKYPPCLAAFLLIFTALPLLAGENKATTKLLETSESYLWFLGHADEAAQTDGLAPWQVDEFMAEGAIKTEGWKEANLTGVSQRLLDQSRVPVEFAHPEHLRERAVNAWYLEGKRALHMGQEKNFRNALSSLVLAAPNHSQVAGDLAREWNDNQTVKSLSRLTQAEQVERLLKDSPHEFSMQARREKLQLDERHNDELVLRAWSENGWWDNPEIDDLKMRIKRRQADTENVMDVSVYITLIAAYDAGSSGDVASLRVNLEKLEGSAMAKGWVHMSLERELAVLEAQLAKVIPMDRSWQTADGASTTLGQVLGDGQALLLDFYASWCHPCMDAMPALAERAAQFGPKGLVVVGVNVEGDPAKARAVREKFKLTLPWLMDTDDDSGLASLLAIEAIPYTALVSAEGKLLYLGSPESPLLAAKLDAL